MLAVATPAAVSAWAFAKQAAGPLTTPPALLIADPQSAPDAFRALADAGAFLSTHDWLHLTVGKVAADEHAPAVAALVPGAIRACSDDPDLALKLAAHVSVVGTAPPRPEWRRWAAEVAHTRGTTDQRLIKQAQLAVLRGAQTVPVTGDTAGPGIQKLAEAVALYRIAAVAASTDDTATRVAVLCIAGRTGALTRG